MSKSIYLVAYYYIKPNTKQTQKPGWMDDPNGFKYDEQIAIARRLKTKDLTTAKVILDLTNRTVYRNSWKSDTNFDDLFEHFYEGYSKYLDPVIKELGYEFVEVTKNETVSQDRITSD